MRVLISGYYGFGNLGDEAVLAGLLRGLRDRGVHVTVLSGDPADTRRRHGVDAVHRVVGLLPALLRSDALISGGGGLLQNRTSGRSLRYYLTVIRLARALRRRVVVFGQSIGPLDRTGEDAVRSALRGIAIHVRDAASADVLRRLDLGAHVGADAALALADAEPAPPPPNEAPVLLVPRAGTPELNAVVVDTARRLRDAGLPLASLAMHPAEDRAVVADLAHALGDGVVRVLEPATVGDVLAAIEGSRYVVSVRLHPLVLAAARGRGHAGLVYDPKVRGFLEASGGLAIGATGEGGIALHDALAERDPNGARAGDLLEAAALAAAPADSERRAAMLAAVAEGFDWLEAALKGDAPRPEIDPTGPR